MKYLITESQHKRLFEEEQKVIHIPDIKVFGGWKGFVRFMESKGNLLYSLGTGLDLNSTSIESLGNLISVSGDLILRGSNIKSLGNLTSVGGNLYLNLTQIKSLGNLTFVGGNLFLEQTPIESLGNLTYVGGYLDLNRTPISKKYSKEEIRQIVNVKGKIYL